MTEVSKACIVRYMGDRLWRWMVPEIYYILLLGVIGFVAWKACGIVGSDVVTLCTMGVVAIWCGNRYYRDSGPIFVIGMLTNLVIFLIWSLFHLNEEPHLVLLVAMMVMILSPGFACGFIEIAKHIFAVYRAAVEYCTPKEGE